MPLPVRLLVSRLLAERFGAYLEMSEVETSRVIRFMRYE